MQLTRFKKIIALSGAVLTVTLLCVPPVRAQLSATAEMILSRIDQTTRSINAGVSSIGAYIYDIDHHVTNAPPYNANNLWGNTYWIEQYVYASLVALNSWLIQDTSKPTADLQSSLTMMSNSLIPNPAGMLPLQQRLTSEFFGAGATPATLPNANDLAYETLLNQPYFTNDPRNNPNTGAKVDAAYNYLKNISGLTITHPMINSSWQGSPTDLQKYQSFYNTISAVQTYNAYVLSQIYLTYKNGSPFTDAQVSLINTATGSGWFSTVASENIGFVLRQILMFSSQTYVLLSQLVNAQNQMVQTQAMTNSLLILMNQSTEQILMMKASGTMQQP